MSAHLVLVRGVHAHLLCLHGSRAEALKRGILLFSPFFFPLLFPSPLSTVIFIYVFTHVEIVHHFHICIFHTDRWARAASLIFLKDCFVLNVH